MTLMEAYLLVEKNPALPPFLCRENFKHGRMVVIEEPSGSLLMQCPKCGWSARVDLHSPMGARLIVRGQLTQAQIENGTICPACLWATDITRTCRHPHHKDDHKVLHYVSRTEHRKLPRKRRSKR